MTEVLEYKCPCCSGKIEFDAESQQMKCPYCDAEITMDAIKEQGDGIPEESQMDWDISSGEWNQEEIGNMRVYSCRSCGGEIIADQTTSASKCPYCDNPVVMTGQFAGDLRPDYVIPFKLDRESAKSALLKHFEGKKLLPKVFRSQHQIDEIKGVYVPVWLFDAEADASITFKAHKSKTWHDANFDYEETSYYSAVRKGKMAFEHIPVDGSSKMDDDLMESIEPFNFKDAVEFQTAYLSGYLADKYDVDSEQSMKHANERVRKSVEEAFQKTVTGYESISTEKSEIHLENGKAVYALYPVWLLNISWNGTVYKFAMNGETGKFVGNLPLDKGQAVKKFLLIMTIIAVIAYFILYMVSVSLIIGAVIAGIVVGIMWSDLKSVSFKKEANDYIKTGSLNISFRNDKFLYKKTDKKPREKSENNQKT
ncbi:MAG: hypothetical protein V3G42_11115 [Oscillospiraceae bacterium]